jgi:hypothetical protein
MRAIKNIELVFFRIGSSKVLLLFFGLAVLLNYFEFFTTYDDLRGYSIAYGYFTFRFFSSLSFFLKDKWMKLKPIINLLIEVALDSLSLSIFLLFFYKHCTNDYSLGIFVSYIVSIIINIYLCKQVKIKLK